MQIKSMAECSLGAFCNTLDLPLAAICFKTFVLSIFEWPFKTGFIVGAVSTIDICTGGQIKTVKTQISLALRELSAQGFFPFI